MQTGSTIAIDACELVLAKPRPEHNILSVCLGHELVSIRLVPCVTRLFVNNREPTVHGRPFCTWFVPLNFHNRLIIALEYVKPVDVQYAAVSDL